MTTDGQSLTKLVELMRTLLGPNGCPWDREQTLETLRPYVVEEAHEVVDAIDQGKPEMLREELGDLLLQIVFQAELATSKGLVRRRRRGRGHLRENGSTPSLGVR